MSVRDTFRGLIISGCAFKGLKSKWLDPGLMSLSSTSSTSINSFSVRYSSSSGSSSSSLCCPKWLPWVHPPLPARFHHHRHRDPVVEVSCHVNSWFCVACLHICSTQQLLLQWRFNAPTEGIISSSNIILSQILSDVLKPFTVLLFYTIWGK